MPVRGLIPANSHVEVDFQAHSTNSGSALIGSGWIGGPDHEVEATTLAPGGQVRHSHQERGARALRLHIDVPDDGGSVNIEVHADGKLVDRGTENEDRFWTYIVED
ncbi:MAG: hypothetical protein IIC18_08015 [Bacteroidetes bacterium]|nr:hypothetical protein [Bacteroidota bacterium]